MPNFADILAAVIILFCIVMGYRRGLSGELARAISWLVVLVLGILLKDPLGAWLTEHTRLEGRAALAVAYLVIIIVGIITIIIVSLVVTKLVKFVVAEGADKLVGSIIGFAKGIIVVLVMFILFNLWPHEYLNRVFGEQSMIGMVVIRCMPEIQETLQETGEKIEKQMEEDREDVWE